MGHANKFYDSRFSFLDDNPFGKNKHDMLEQLREIFSKTPESFRVVDWIEDSRSFRISNIYKNRCFGQRIPEHLIDSPDLHRHVCGFLSELGEKITLIPELKEYISNTKPVIQQDQEPEPDQEPEQEPEQEDFAALTGEIHRDFDVDPKMIYKNSEDIASYNVLSGKILSYADVCRLTVAISRSQLTISVVKDENALFAEEREKAKLRKELEKYLKNSDLSNAHPVDVNNLNLVQLQYYTTQCKDMYESLKIFEVVKKGIEIADFGYGAIFPNGIKIPGKNKAIKLNGTADAFKTMLFDRKSPLSIAFKNLTEKYNWHISDEALLGVNIGQALVRRIEIVDLEEHVSGSGSGSEESVAEEVSRSTSEE